MTPPAPTFEVIGDGRLSDEAIEALAALLIAVHDQEKEEPAKVEVCSRTEASK
ncbi:MAG: hypothetical protein IAF94_18430 [Pirellulaceae bacterium]|nr:hypothetical protein [Pirellulaceae bacterium]